MYVGSLLHTDFISEHVVGVEAIEDSYYQMYTNGQDTPNNELQVIDAAITTTGKGNGYEHALLSYFSRVNYIFNDKYFFQFQNS